MAKVQFNTTAYRFSHGKEPRGWGPWAFEFEGETGPRFFSGKYGEAKKQATTAARKANVRTVKVGP